MLSFTLDPLVILLVGIVIVIGGILAFRLHAFVALTLAGITVAMITSAGQLEEYAGHFSASKVSQGDWSEGKAADFVKETSTRSAPARFAAELGNTAGKIAILIAMAAIIGKCLLDSGAADRIVRSSLAVVGEARAAVAFVFSGFLLGIPVFFDTVFYLMIPLGKALRMRTGANYTLYVLAIVAGGTMAHSLVPPTPGPLFVAEELNVGLGLMIIAGTLVGLVTASVGYGWAVYANRRWQVPLRETPDMSLADLETQAAKADSELPPLWLSLLPILLPVVFIAGNAVVKNYQGSVYESVSSAFALLGDKNIALIIAAAIALVTLAWQKKASRAELATAVGAALASGGVIILITAAGGGFGGVLRQTGIGLRIEELANDSGMLYSLWLLPIAWLVTTTMRTAQGSATVAMITAVSILAPLVEASDGLTFHPVYIALAIGCGSKPLAWMNDSGFWVICKMSGFTEGEGLKLITPMSAAMGIVGLGVTVLGAWIWPMN